MFYGQFFVIRKKFHGQFDYMKHILIYWNNQLNSLIEQLRSEGDFVSRLYLMYPCLINPMHVSHSRHRCLFFFVHFNSFIFCFYLKTYLLPSFYPYFLMYPSFDISAPINLHSPRYPLCRKLMPNNEPFF